MELVIFLLATATAGLGGYGVLVRLGLDDFEAWAAGRVAGLILVALPSWWLGVIGVTSWRLIGAGVLALWAIPGILALWQRKAWRQVLSAEAVFSVSAVFVIVVRLDHPGIMLTEKPMDLGIFASLLRSDGFPPPDMWLAGEALPYYYWGALLWTVPLMVSKLPLDIGYNLIVGLIGGMVGALMWSLGRRVGGGHLAGLLVAFFGVFAGTPDGLRQLFAGVSMGSLDFWHSSRQVADTITEFPLFTLWLGDLHPHLLSMPVACLGLLIALKAGEEGPDWIQVAALTVVFGVCWAANPWSMPPTFAAIALALVASDRKWYWPLGEGRRRWLAILSVGVGGWIVTAPFHLGFHPFFDGIGLVSSWTTVGEITLYAGCLLSAATLAAVGILKWVLESRSEAGRAAVLSIGAAIVVVAAATARPTLVLLAVLLTVFIMAVLRLEPGAGRPGLALAALGVFLFLVPEVVFVSDGYGDALHRMNTVFKSYIQGWVFLAVALPILLRWGIQSRWLRGAIVGLLLVLALPHPVDMVIRQFRAESLGFSGLEWMSEGDRALVNALRKEPGGTYLAEATGDPYSVYGRLSAASGVPTLLGWENHEMIWRGDEILDETSRRKDLISKIYNCADPDEVRRLAGEAGLHLIAIGSLETNDFSAQALDAIASAGELVVDVEGAKLVRVGSPVAD